MSFEIFSNTGSKSYKEVSFKTRETHFLYRNPQKPKIAKKNIFRKRFSENFFENFFLLCELHSSEKAKTRQLCLQNAVVSAEKREKEFMLA